MRTGVREEVRGGEEKEGGKGRRKDGGVTCVCFTTHTRQSDGG